ncbi:MAG: (d)CMP kinase, partial [Planctomycetes bacterium]|nr:(d)CMP kinase [Planctomycetota bacterium]
EALVDIQRGMARSRPAVMEGRDITTVVLKEARWKFFLTADAEERAKRRKMEMEEKGHTVDFAQLLDEIIKRDESDRQVGPMKEAMEIAAREDGDIVMLDTTSMTPDEVVNSIVERVKAGMEGLA